MNYSNRLKKKELKINYVPYQYVLLKNDKKKIIRKSNFFSYYDICVDVTLRRRLRYDGVNGKILKFLIFNNKYIKFHYFIDPIYLYLKFLELLNFSVYLYKKNFGIKRYIPPEKLYQLRKNNILNSFYRACKYICSLIKNSHKVLNLRVDFIIFNIFSSFFFFNFNEIFLLFKQMLDLFFLNKFNLQKNNISTKLF